MKVRRYSLFPALFLSAILFVASGFAQPAHAQDKQDDKDAPKKDLLTVQPPPKQIDPASDKATAQDAQTAGPQKPGGDVVITNTDLITFNVTVTDIYGRFVSGLGKG